MRESSCGSLFWRPFGCTSNDLYRRLVIINIAFPPAIHSKINIRNDFLNKDMSKRKNENFKAKRKLKFNITENTVGNTLIVSYKIICKPTQHKKVNNFEYGTLF